MKGLRLEPALLDALRGGGWKIAGRRADGGVVASRGSHHYLVKLQAASEGRRDRLIPLLSRAILEGKALAARGSGLAALAVVAAPRIGEPVAEALRAFAADVAPGVAVGLIDEEGLRSFVGPGLESLNAARTPTARSTRPAAQASVHLFSDLNQWMLKALLSPHIDRGELMPARFPGGGYRNVSELAEATDVSVMSAFRFVRQLDREGFLHESSDRLRLVRIDALLQRWRAANQRPPRVLNARWILAGAEAQLPRAVERLGKPVCLGLFSAARAMGLGHVQGVPAQICVTDFRFDVLKRAGLIQADPGDPVDVVLRIPSTPESVFRGVVTVDGQVASDVLQVWLDVSGHPARGKEQADLIYRRVIKPMIKHAAGSGR